MKCGVEPANGDNPAFVDKLLLPYADKLKTTEAPFDYQAFKEQQYDLLADHIRQHVDIPRLYQILQAHD